jgi:hypothetical protein
MKRFAIHFIKPFTRRHRKLELCFSLDRPALRTPRCLWQSTKQRVVIGVENVMGCAAMWFSLVFVLVFG